MDKLKSTTEFSNSMKGFSGDIIIGESGSSLVLDNERGEIVRTMMNPTQKGANPEKGLTALRNHCAAERRRRHRINGHLTCLRTMIPAATNSKMDKASLLAEVVKHLKELKRNAAEAAKYMLIPMDIDEVRVEHLENGSDGGSYFIRASLCCEYKHEVLSDLKNALESLHLKTVREEIATFGSRMTNRFIVTGWKEGKIKDVEGCQLLANAVRQALRSVLDKICASEDSSAKDMHPNKRRKISSQTSPSSLSLGDLW